MIIQVILIALTVLTIVYFLSNQNSMQMRAYKKLALLGFIILMLVFILSPESLNTIAHKVGVGRGADLLLYCLSLAFIVFTLNVYLKFKGQQDKTFRLARRIALLEAHQKYKK